MTDVLHAPVVELVRAAMDPASGAAQVRSESPACRVVSAAARADVADGGNERLTQLAIGAGVAAGTLTDVLSGECGKSSGDFVRQLGQEARGGVNPDVVRLLEDLLRSESGMKDFAIFLVELFDRDQERYLDMIVSLGEYVAACVDALAGARSSSVDEVMAELVEMLEEFYTE
jgi:hypothetical protein